MKTELMSANRNFVLAGKHPWVIQVYRDQPTKIPRPMVKDAIAAGMIFVDDSGKTEAALVEKPVAPLLQAEELIERVYQAFAECVEHNNAADFAASGAPSQAAISIKIGQKIDQKEVNRLWRNYKAEQEEKAQLIKEAAVVPPTKKGE